MCTVHRAAATQLATARAGTCRFWRHKLQTICRSEYLVCVRTYVHICVHTFVRTRVCASKWFVKRMSAERGIKRKGTHSPQNLRVHINHPDILGEGKGKQHICERVRFGRLKTDYMYVLVCLAVCLCARVCELHDAGKVVTYL